MGFSPFGNSRAVDDTFLFAKNYFVVVLVFATVLLTFRCREPQTLIPVDRYVRSLCARAPRRYRVYRYLAGRARENINRVENTEKSGFRLTVTRERCTPRLLVAR